MKQTQPGCLELVVVGPARLAGHEPGELLPHAALAPVGRSAEREPGGRAGQVERWRWRGVDLAEVRQPYWALAASVDAGADCDVVPRSPDEHAVDHLRDCRPP